MKSKSICLSISRRNKDIVEVIDEYADMLGISKSGAVFHIIKDYDLKDALEIWNVSHERNIRCCQNKDAGRTLQKDALVNKKCSEKKKYPKELVRSLCLTLQVEPMSGTSIDIGIEIFRK